MDLRWINRSDRGRPGTGECRNWVLIVDVTIFV